MIEKMKTNHIKWTDIHKDSSRKRKLNKIKHSRVGAAIKAQKIARITINKEISFYE